MKKNNNNYDDATQKTGNKRIMIGIITSGIILFSIFIVSSIMDSERSKAFDGNNMIKYYTSIQIESGDTLWTIANQYVTPEYDSIREYIEEVKLLNRMGSDDIQSGQYLTVPYYSSKFQ